jgi:uncharacterized protein (DUF1919 family)
MSLKTSKFKQLIAKIVRRMDIRLLRNKNFVIIANNCWGAELYKWLGREYNTPFVGLFLYSPCYLTLLENFNYLISKDLVFISNSKYFNETTDYPIGCLGDIEIHFLHYKNPEEALLKWKRRIKRMQKEPNLNNYFFKICDRELIDLEDFYRFHKLPFKNKISFGLFDSDEKNHIKVTENDNKKCVPDGVTLYDISFRYLDIVKWVKTGRKTRTLFSKVKTFFLMKKSCRI